MRRSEAAERAQGEARAEAAAVELAEVAEVAFAGQDSRGRRMRVGLVSIASR